MDQQADALAATRPAPAARVTEDYRARYDGGKSPTEIEEDIARTRVRLGATIEALEREFAPNRVLEKGAELLRSSLEPAPGPFREQAWAYAIPLALITLGLGSLFVLRRSYFAETPSGFGEMPVEAVETGETPYPAPAHADVVEPIESVPLTDERR